MRSDAEMAMWDAIEDILTTESAAAIERAIAQITARYPTLQITAGRSATLLQSGPPLLAPQPPGARLPMVDLAKTQLIFAPFKITIVYNNDEFKSIAGED